MTTNGFNFQEWIYMVISKDYIVITGGGTGIGHSLAILLAQRNHRVLIVGRQIENLKRTQDLNPSQIEIVQADISDAKGRLDILNAIPKDAKISCLIHNAAIIESCELKLVTIESWRYQMSVNLEAPLFLTQLLLASFKKGSRVLHLSSKLAHEPCHGVGVHCVSKAALHMLFNCLKQELNKHDIYIGSLRPGAVDTPTQDKVRTFLPETFPMAPVFQALKDDKKLQHPSKVAKFIAWVLFGTTNEIFSEAEWNIYDNWHHDFWLDESKPIDSVDLTVSAKG